MKLNSHSSFFTILNVGNGGRFCQFLRGNLSNFWWLAINEPSYINYFLIF